MTEKDESETPGSPTDKEESKTEETVVERLTQPYIEREFGSRLEPLGFQMLTVTGVKNTV